MMPYSKPKVNSVQEACGKCFAVLLSKFEILQTTHTKKKKRPKNRPLPQKYDSKNIFGPEKDP